MNTLFSSNSITANKNIFYPLQKYILMLIIFHYNTLHENIVLFLPVSCRISNREHSKLLRKISLSFYYKICDKKNSLIFANKLQWTCSMRFLPLLANSFWIRGLFFQIFFQWSFFFQNSAAIQIVVMEKNVKYPGRWNPYLLV